MQACNAREMHPLIKAVKRVKAAAAGGGGGASALHLHVCAHVIVAAVVRECTCVCGMMTV